jgi:hypothetical protein
MRVMSKLRVALACGVASLATFPLSASGAFRGPEVPAIQPPSLLGTVQSSGNTYVVRVDRSSLRPLRGRRIGAGPHLHGWTRSPSRSRLAFAPHPGRVLEFLDVRTMRLRGNMTFPRGGVPVWLAPRGLLWIDTSEVLVIDPDRRRLLATRKIEGRFLDGVRVGTAVALLVAPRDGIGPSRLLVVGSDASVRSVSLGRILSGWTASFDERQPGVAFDRERGRVFVADPDGLVAEVDVATLGVEYHSLSTTTAVPQPEPGRRAFRKAHWLGDGLLAVSGWDLYESRDAIGRVQTRSEPAGLALVDTRTWRLQTLDERADSFRFVSRLLLATGNRWDAVAGTNVGMGVAGYALDGSKRFHFFEGKPAWLAEAYAGRAYAWLGANRYAIVDLSQGVVVGERRDAPARLLLDDGVSLFGR